MCPGHVLPCVQNPSKSWKHSQVSSWPTGLLYSKQVVALWFYNIKVTYWILLVSLCRSHKDGWALHWPDKESTSNPKNDQPGIPSSDYPPGTKLPHAGKSPSPGNVDHAFNKKTQNMKLLTVHHTESSCCQVKFGFSLLRTGSEIFGSGPNVLLLPATPQPVTELMLCIVSRPALSLEQVLRMHIYMCQCIYWRCGSIIKYK